MIKNGYRSKKTQDLFLSLKEGDIVVVYDTETTGLSAEKDRILEFAAEKFIIGKDYEIKLIDNIQIYINPEFPIPPKSTDVHGITDEFIADKPTENDVFPVIYKWLNGVSVCGHNIIAFDNRFIKAMFARHGYEFNPKLSLDTLQAARDLIDSKSVPGHSLGTVAKLYGADEGISFHTAKDDVYANGKVFQIFLDEYKAKADALKPFSSMPRTAEEMLKSIQSRQAEMPKKIPYIKGMALQIYHHSKNNRLYFYTDCGSIYYDRYNKCWGHNPDKMKVPFESIDMEKFISRALWLAKVENEEELAKLKPTETVWF